MKSIMVGCILTGLVLSLSGPAWSDEEADAALQAQLDLGYRGVSQTGNTVRAAEYQDLESGPVGSFEFNKHTESMHLLIDGKYTTENDLDADIHVDVPGTFKLNLSTERLWHNLEHIPYDQTLPESRQDGYTQLDPAGPPPGDKLRVTFEDQNPNDDYGLRVERDTAEAIFNMGSYPGHVKLKYWRWEKTGQEQLRFVEEGHDNIDPLATGTCNNCHVQSKTQEIKRVTEEVSGRVDAHVGFFDLSFDQLFRVFTVKDPIPVDNFDGHFYGPNPGAGGAYFQHSEDPESTLVESTIKARTSLTGGVIADGAYTYGRRENKSTMAARPLGVDGIYAVSEYDKVAGNLSWTPTETVTANFRYRLLDLDVNNSDTLSADYNIDDKTFPVRENMDIRRIEYSGTVSWRPSYALTIKGDYDHEVITRGNTGGPVVFHGRDAAQNPPTNPDGHIDDVWELPQEEVIDTLRLGLTSRPLKNSNLKLKAWYRYVTSSEPAYGTSFDSRHEVFASAHYVPRKSSWGLSASARGQKDYGEDHPHSVWDTVVDPTPPSYPTLSETAVYQLSDRDRELQSFNLGGWVNTQSNVSAGLNYGYTRTKIIQDILFGASDLLTTDATQGFYNVDAESEYLQESHSCSLYTTIQMGKSVALRLDGYVTLSSAEFSPDEFYFLYPTTPGGNSELATTNLIVSSEYINEISRIHFVQQGLSAGLDWQPAEQWTVGLLYAIDDYSSSNTDVFDGTAQAGTITLSRAW